MSNKYIYLDWNVLKNVKNPRKDKEELDKLCQKLIFKLKKKYKFPICEAHFKDRLSRFDKTYINEVRNDFKYFESISEGFYIDKDLFLVEKKDSVMKCLNFFIEENEKKIKLEYEQNNYIENIDLTKIEKHHPFYEFLIENNGCLDLRKLDEYMFNNIFDDSNVYKKLRDFVECVDKNSPMYKVACNWQNKLTLFLDSFNYDESTLLNKWEIIVREYISINENLTPDLGNLLTIGYSLLDFHPLFKEKLKKNKNTLSNIIRDSKNIYYASKAEYFISEDKNTVKKAEFIYKVFGIKTKVINESKFEQIFS